MSKPIDILEPVRNGNGEGLAFNGLTIRDYYAGHILGAVGGHFLARGIMPDAEVAKAIFEFTDIMLEARVSKTA